jgi:hypothetical protein
MKTLWILLGVVVVGGGIYMATMNKDKAVNTNEVKDETSQTQTEQTNESTGRYKAEFTEKTSMKAIAEAGGSYQCTVASNVAVAETTGTVYIANKKIRGEFESFVPQANMTVRSNFISDGMYAYTWSDMMPSGIKIKLDAEASTTTSGAQNNYEEMLDYSCKAWVADNAKFAVPASITFKEVNGN